MFMKRVSTSAQLNNSYYIYLGTPEVGFANVNDDRKLAFVYISNIITRLYRTSKYVILSSKSFEC